MLTLAQALETFVHDSKVRALLILIAFDLLLGVIAAVKLGTFKLSWITNFLRDDVLFKVLPYFVLYFGALVAGGSNFAAISGLDLNVVSDSVYALAIAAMVGSLVGSLKDLGIITVPTTIT